MKSPILYMMAGMMLTLTACSSDDGTQEQEDSRILLTAKVNQQQTRAGQDIQNTQFNTNELMNIYLYEIKNNTAMYGSYASTGYVFQVLDENGTLRPQQLSYPYYPTNGNPIKIVGLYPKSDFVNVTKSTTEFTVSTNQSSPTSYRNSDLMYAELDNWSKPAGGTPAPLVFNHKLTKINVNLIPATGLEQVIFKNATVTLKNVVYKTKFNGSTGVRSELTTAEQADPDNRKDILVTTNGFYNSSAIIVPQTRASGAFIEIVMSNNDLLTYELPQEIEFGEGKAYTFNITVKQDAIMVGSYEIVDWVTGASLTIPHTDTQFTN